MFWIISNTERKKKLAMARLFQAQHARSKDSVELG
jgi:hypothetical protein